MENKLIKITEKSNIEISEDNIEILLNGCCRSYECEDFRANECRMKIFLGSIEKDEKWNFSHTWVTPSKFILHMINNNEEPVGNVLDLMNHLKEKYNCLASDKTCECDFFDEMKLVKKTLEENKD